MKDKKGNFRIGIKLMYLPGTFILLIFAGMKSAGEAVIYTAILLEKLPNYQFSVTVRRVARSGL